MFPGVEQWTSAMVFALLSGREALALQLVGAAFLMAIAEMESVGLYYGPRTPR